MSCKWSSRLASDYTTILTNNPSVFNGQLAYPGSYAKRPSNQCVSYNNKWSKNFDATLHQRRNICRRERKFTVMRTRLLLQPANRNAGWQHVGKSQRQGHQEWCSAACRKIPTSFPSKVPLLSGIWTPSNTQCLQPTGVYIPNNISIGFHTLLHSLLSLQRQTDPPIDWLTDHAIPSVAIGRIWLVLGCCLITTIIIYTFSSCRQVMYSNWLSLTMSVTIGDEKDTRNSCGRNTCSIYNRFLDDSNATTSSLDGSVSVSPLSYKRPRPETIVPSTDPKLQLQYRKTWVHFTAMLQHISIAFNDVHIQAEQQKF